MLPREAIEQCLPDPSPLLAYAQGPARDSGWQKSLTGDRKGKTRQVPGNQGARGRTIREPILGRRQEGRPCMNPGLKTDTCPFVP